MTSEVQASEAQQELFRQLGEGTNFVLDIYDSPKRQFCVLAKLLGWEGGGEPWNTHWLKCFDQVYVWRAPVIVKPTGASVDNTDTHYAAAPSASVTPAPSDAGGSVSSVNLWSRFKGFVPDPGASFNHEFYRLAKHQGWDKEERRRFRVELFDADFAAYIGSDVFDLDLWKELCRLCSIDPIPDDIPSCMEALDDVLVNIYDLLDHQRTGAPIEPFTDFEEFRTYTLNGHVYPIEEAKADSFLPVFLKELHPRHRR